MAPSEDLFSALQFYWDSYFIILGLLVSGRAKFARGMVDNFIYLFRRFGRIPSHNRFINLVGSQPPFLTSMGEEINAVLPDRSWLRRVYEVAETELATYWLAKTPRRPHLVYRGLSRYCHHHATVESVHYESGWDFTSRFIPLGLDLLPVDLNACLYQYEVDLAEFHSRAGKKARAAKYRERAAARRRDMINLMWDSRRGFFFDYDYARKRRNPFWSLAGFYPLWAGLATPEQAEACVKNLSRFSFEGGLATTQSEGLSFPPRQWDYPNGWANLQWIVIKGLLNYGYREQARSIAKNWLGLNTRVFMRTGKFWERYDVVKMREGESERYPIQTGFGWTNAVYLCLLKEFPELLKD